MTNFKKIAGFLFVGLFLVGLYFYFTPADLNYDTSLDVSNDSAAYVNTSEGSEDVLSFHDDLGGVVDPGSGSGIDPPGAPIGDTPGDGDSSIEPPADPSDSSQQQNQQNSGGDDSSSESPSDDSSEETEIVNEVPETGFIGVTYALLSSAVLCLFALVFVLRPRRSILSAFEQNTLKKIK